MFPEKDNNVTGRGAAVDTPHALPETIMTAIVLKLPPAPWLSVKTQFAGSIRNLMMPVLEKLPDVLVITPCAPLLYGLCPMFTWPPELLVKFPDTSSA